MIDAHHHIWLQKDLPWLLEPEQPRIFGSYSAIKRDYTIDEYLEDIKGSGIEKSVYVQANWAPDQYEQEVAWVQSVSEEMGWPHAIVGYADFTSPDVRPQLDALSKYPLMRGVRQQFHWHENPIYRFAAQPDLCEQAHVQRNIAYLADYGWSFDLQLFTSQMYSGAELAMACPQVTFILQHAGMLEDASAMGVANWSDSMEALASCPNVVTKLSAFGTFIHRNDPAFIAEMINRTINIFGAKRCMFGSNFPIEKIWTSYHTLLTAFENATTSLGVSCREAIFYRNATRIYRI